MTPSVFIDGGHGTTGLEIADRLAGRSDIELLAVEEARRRDPAARAALLNAADAVVLCLPDDAAREAVALIRNPATIVIDASTAHRTAPGWAYGFPEVTGREAVARARRISNPGCYSTGFIALVAPLVAAGLIPTDRPLTCNAVSGYSGGGKAMIAAYEEAPAPAAWAGYALTLAHKHVAEMRVRAGLAVAPLFAPAVVNVRSGMVVDVPLPGGPAAERLRDALTAHYAGSAVVRVMDDAGDTLPIERLAGTDRLDLFVFSDAAGTQVRLVAVLDNLGKGAAGAAVQNLNLALGLNETEGLRL